MRVPVLVTVLLLLLTACGGGDARESSAKARASAAAQGDAVDTEEGTFVPEALRSFRCEADGDKEWFAVGTIKNTTKQPVTYRVFVQVGEGGDEVAASEMDLPTVAAGKTTEFTFEELPAAGSDGPCRVQVLAVPPEG